MMICRICSQEKTETEFYRCSNKSGLQTACKKCMSAQQMVNYRKKNPVVKKKRRNIDKTLGSYQNQYNKQRRAEDIQYKLQYNLRCRLRTALKGGYKRGSAIKDLGCSIEELIKYIEARFQPGMTWDNYGTHGWHIDHIQPLSLFDLTDPAQFKTANQYTNLQPLWARDNLTKFNKVLATNT